MKKPAMTRGFIASLFLILTLAAASLVMLAQNGQQTEASAETSDFSGVWDRPPFVKGRPEMYFSAQEPPMLPPAAKTYQENRKGTNKATNEMGRPDRDPSQFPYCMPFGFPRVYAYRDAFEVVQVPDRVYILFESGDVQRIYTDGRGFPQGPPLSFMGQSIGRWEGDTLVVQTKDMTDMTWLDSMGLPHSSDLRVEQHIRKTAPDMLELTFQFDDPKTFTKPWGGTKVYKKRENTARNAIFPVYLCEDRVTPKFSDDVLSKFKKP